MKNAVFTGILLFTGFTSVAQIHDTLSFRGQLSGWGNFNPSLELPCRLGARYIPQINYGRHPIKGNPLDFEASVNLQYNVGFSPFDTISSEMLLKPYRIWARYSKDRLEVRAGLQKINFGSATMLRPLMWFDKMDPRDPLQLTDGVYGILGRYYFLNNGNIWLWGLWGNKDPKTWEVGKTLQKIPEAGGRFQYPVPRGEAAVSYHFRLSDTRLTSPGVIPRKEVPEHRVGMDGKWDIGPGIWLEGSLISKTKDIGSLTNQVILTGGTDFTFSLGNGLTLMIEHLVFIYNRKLSALSNDFHFSALSLSYPIGLFDHLNGMMFFDWHEHQTYSFLSWKKQFKHISLYAMAYWNPSEYQLPQMTGNNYFFGGKGLQLMVVYTH